MTAAARGAAWMGVAAALRPLGAAAAPRRVFTRRNVYCLAGNSRELKSYRKAVAEMKALPATDPTSWLAQANIHAAFSPPPGMIANQCQHGTFFFLSWHRMYLHFFERILRDKSHDPNFALPYWGFSPSGRRDLPEPFRTPATASNPLYTSNRNASINGGASMSASIVDAGTALSQVPFGLFQSALEGTPHGNVHVAVGGGMATFQGAGQDPIFWLHHANIDRLWEIWLATGGGRANPTGDPSWMNTSYSFYDETGATVTMTGADIVDTACQLRYQYESDACDRELVFDPRWWRRYSRIGALDPKLIAILASTTPAPHPPPPALAEAREVRLGGRRVDVRLAVTEEAKRLLSTFPSDPAAAGQPALVLGGIEVKGTPKVAYEIYVNLPRGERPPTYTDPHYVGNVNLFGPSPKAPHDHDHAEREQVIGLLPAMLRLRQRGAWTGAELTVTFVPRGLVEGDDPAKVLGAATQVTIGRIAIRQE